MPRLSTINAVIAVRDYWAAVHEAAYRAGDEAGWRQANAELGALLQPMERLTGRRWEWSKGGINDPCWR